MTDERRQKLLGELLAMLPQPSAPRWYRRDEDGYLVAVGVGGTDGEEITEKEYNAIRAVLAEKPTPPAGYDFRLREDLEWQMYLLPEEDGEESLDPARALELICGTSALTKSQAEAYRADILSAKQAREERKEKSE